MANLKGKLPFINGIYKDDDGELIKVVEREKRRDGTILIHHVNQRGVKEAISSDIFYVFYKRMKEGTPFHIEEGWNE